MNVDLRLGDCLDVLPTLEPDSVNLAFWSPPYHVGKLYEQDQSYSEWQSLLRQAIALQANLIKPGGFVVVNIADILCFPDSQMPRIQAETLGRRNPNITRDAVIQAQVSNPDAGRDALAQMLGCSEQTIDRRLNGNNARGGKQNTQTRVHLVGDMIEQYAQQVGMYLYDRRVWVKDAAWETSRWHSLSYRSVDEFEYLYFLWKPGVTVIDRTRLGAGEWGDWGSRAVWNIRSVRVNNDHEAMFPVELAYRVVRLLSGHGDTVLDPFMGSGTTGIACMKLGRNFIGIEKDEGYFKIAERRIAQAQAQLALPINL